MPNASEIKWGSYKEFEGPVYYGKHKYVLPANPTEPDEQLLVLTTTEGGTYDAYNGYDVCISTSGLIQWCDKAPYFLVSKMFGYVADRNFELLQPVVSLAQEFGWEFRKNSKGGWRWHRGNIEMTEKRHQHELYFGGASGLRGSFDDEQKMQAKRYAAAVAAVWENEEAQKYQREYTAPKLTTFQMRSAKDVYNASFNSDGPWAKTFRAAFTSFAANNPLKTAQALEYHVAQSGVRFDRDWVCGALRAMVFRPSIAIYPHRYDKIRPVLERLYGTDLPDFAEELKSWQDSGGFWTMCTPKGIQLALLSLGYDIGPSGADGVLGNRSVAALRQFEQESDRVPKEFKDGTPDEYTMSALAEALEASDMVVDLTA